MSLSKQVVTEDKSEKTEVFSQPPQEKLPEKLSNSQESEEKNDQKKVEIKVKQGPARVRKPKRRIIRKVNRDKAPQLVKKESKTFRKQINESEIFVNMTADIPALTGIRSA